MYTRIDRALKRCLDIAGAATGLAATAPLLVGLAALVRVSSPGPVLFQQERVGRHGKPFRMHKFRTMRAAKPGLQVTAGGDPRITRIGRVLRKTKLDELPELWNVLVGDMSLVGPRPEVPRYVAMYPENDRVFLQKFRPGVTDPATIVYRSEEDVLARAPDPEKAYVEDILPRKVRMYREYLQTASFGTDLMVLLQTLRAIVVPRPDASKSRPTEEVNGRC